MPFAWFVALRYMREARGQTLLILSAVSVGVSVIVFLSALINGLQRSLIETTLGSQSHVTLEPRREAPRPLALPEPGRVVARLVQPASQRLRSIDQWPRLVGELEQTGGIRVVSPTVSGSGTGSRLAANAPVLIRGVVPDRFAGIVDVPANLVAGTFALDGGRVVIGAELARELGLTVGDRMRLRSAEQVDDVVTVAGIFALGAGGVDDTWVLTSLRHAQSLFALPGGATAIEMTVEDIFAAEDIAALVRARTGLPAESWMTRNAQLLSGLSAQASSRTMIQVFVVISVTLGIASVLIVSVVQKSREIGILRAVGTPARRVLQIFLIEGGVLGAAGSVIGAGLGAAFAKGFEALTVEPDGSPRFLVLIDLPLVAGTAALAIGIGLLAAVIPARRAARLDPATAIRGS
jgi:lipoprotein-releasing system permease protein